MANNLEQQRFEPLYDYPVSYLFRAYEALVNEGIDLPPLEPPLPEPTISYQPDLPTLRYYKPKHLNWKQVSIWSALFDEQEHRKLLEKKLNEHLDGKIKKDII